MSSRGCQAGDLELTPEGVAHWRDAKRRNPRGVAQMHETQFSGDSLLTFPVGCQVVSTDSQKTTVTIVPPVGGTLRVNESGGVVTITIKKEA